MAEYNKVMTQIKPDLPKVIDTEQIYVYVPKVSYDQAGIVKPDRTQFVIAGDYTLSIKHFEMTDDHVAVDVNTGYLNDTALDDLGDKDFVTKGNVTTYAVPKLTNDSVTLDKVYVERANGRGTTLVNVTDKLFLSDSIVKRDGYGRIYTTNGVIPDDNEVVNSAYVKRKYVEKSGNANRVYTTDNTGADSSAMFSNNAIANTMAYRAYDGSLRGEVVEPIDTTLLNNKYVKDHYIPVGSDGKIPDSYLPASLGNDEIVSGYYFEGKFYLDEEHTQEVTGSADKLYVDLATNLTYRYDEQAGYVLISSSLALGTTHDSAYYGDYGKIAYDHANTVGNPHKTDVNDIIGLDAALAKKIGMHDSSDDPARTVVFVADQSSPIMCVLFNVDNAGTFYTKDAGSETWKAVSVNSLHSGFRCMGGDYEPQIKLNSQFTPIINGVQMTSTEITLPMAMLLDIEFGGNKSDTKMDYYLNFEQAEADAVAYYWKYALSYPEHHCVPLYDYLGRLQSETPASGKDCVNLAYWNANYKPFNYTTISALSSVDDGFNVEYQVNGVSAEIEIPMKGTDDIIVDIDEANKMINVHLDAAVRAKLAKMLVLPAAPPSTTSLVGITANNAQSILTEQESRDAIGVFKMVSMTQDEYNALGTKDNKTLYLITG